LHALDDDYEAAVAEARDVDADDGMDGDVLNEMMFCRKPREITPGRRA
jgi:hypothetical protein